MKRIEILTKFRSGGQSYHAGEIRIVDDALAGHFCMSGWARDLEGELQTGEPDLSPKKLTVTNGVHGNKTEGV